MFRKAIKNIKKILSASMKAGINSIDFKHEFLYLLELRNNIERRLEDLVFGLLIEALVKSYHNLLSNGFLYLYR